MKVWRKQTRAELLSKRSQSSQEGSTCRLCPTTAGKTSMRGIIAANSIDGCRPTRSVGQARFGHGRSLRGRTYRDSNNERAEPALAARCNLWGHLPCDISVGLGFGESEMQFKVIIEGLSRLGLAELCERFVNEQRLPAHLLPQEAADSVLDPFKRGGGPIGAAYGDSKHRSEG